MDLSQLDNEIVSNIISYVVSLETLKHVCRVSHSFQDLCLRPQHWHNQAIDITYRVVPSQLFQRLGNIWMNCPCVTLDGLNSKFVEYLRTRIIFRWRWQQRDWFVQPEFSRVKHILCSEHPVPDDISMRIVLRGLLPSIRVGLTNVRHRRYISEQITNSRTPDFFVYGIVVDNDDQEPEHMPGFFLNGCPIKQGPPLRLPWRLRYRIGKTIQLTLRFVCNSHEFAMYINGVLLGSLQWTPPVEFQYSEKYVFVHVEEEDLSYDRISFWPEASQLTPETTLPDQRGVERR